MNITDEKNILNKYIENLEITDEMYDYIVPLLEADDALFTKIIEEVKNNNLKFNDFYRIFDDIPNYADTIKNSIDAQEKLYNEYYLLYQLLNGLNEQSAELRLNNLGIIKSYITEQDDGTENTISVEDIEKRNILFSLFTEDISDPFKNFYKSMMLNKIVEGIENNQNEAVENMLLSLHDYLVPVDFNHVVLNNTDREFMKANNIKSEDEMKKIKSLAAYAADKYN